MNEGQSRVPGRARGLAVPMAKLATFVVVTIAATAVLAVSIANSDLSESNSYRARFTDVTMLAPGDDVRIAGVRVGQVEQIDIVDRTLAEVTFSVAAGRSLPAGVTAQIKYRNIVGQRYLALGQGASADGGAVLEPGGLIPLDRTRPALDLTELFNGFKPLFQALDPDEVNTLSYELIQVLQGEGGTVESLLAHTASLTATLADRDRVIGELIGNLNGVLDTVNSHGQQLNDLLITVQQLVSGLATDRESIGEAIESLGGLATATSGLLAEARDPLKQDIAALGVLAGNLNDNEQVVEHFIRFLPVKTAALTRTVSYGSWFNFFLCSAEGAVSVPGLINHPINLPISATSMERCSG